MSSTPQKAFLPLKTKICTSHGLYMVHILPEIGKKWHKNGLFTASALSHCASGIRIDEILDNIFKTPYKQRALVLKGGIRQSHKKR